MVHQPRDRILADQFLRHDFYVPPLQSGMPRQRSGARLAPLQRVGSTVGGLVGADRLSDHDLCGRLHRLSPRLMGHPYLSLFLHDDLRLSGPVVQLEAAEAVQVVGAARGRFIP